MKHHMKTRNLAILFAVLCGASLSGCVTTEGGAQPNMLSTQEEIALGEKVAKEVQENEKVLDDPIIQQYVSEIGARLARSSPRQDVPYTFTVIDNPDTVNAFALPGGRMYIYTGLMKICDNEAQLASVMAHEIGHVAEHHHGESLTRQYGYSMLIGLILGDSSPQGAQIAAQIAGTVTELRFSRAQENESDRVGMDILWRAGYQPDAMVVFMERMLQTEGGQGRGRPMLEFLSSHPATTERIAYLRTLVQQYPYDVRVASPVYAERYKVNVLDRLK